LLQCAVEHAVRDLPLNQIRLAHKEAAKTQKPRTLERQRLMSHELSDAFLKEFLDIFDINRIRLAALQVQLEVGKAAKEPCHDERARLAFEIGILETFQFVSEALLHHSIHFRRASPGAPYALDHGAETLDGD
jgi:hypothetical protein